MTSLYANGAAHILGQATKVDLVADNIKYLFYAGAFDDTNEFVSDLTGASIIARSGNLAGKTVGLGVFNANDSSILTVAGAPFTHVIVYKDSGADATSPLVANMDIPTFTPTGADVTVVWNPSGLFAIA